MQFSTPYIRYPNHHRCNTHENVRTPFATVLMISPHPYECGSLCCGCAPTTRWPMAFQPHPSPHKPTQAHPQTSQSPHTMSFQPTIQAHTGTVFLLHSSSACVPSAFLLILHAIRHHPHPPPHHPPPLHHLQPQQESDPPHHPYLPHPHLHPHRLRYTCSCAQT